MIETLRNMLLSEAKTNIKDMLEKVEKQINLSLECSKQLMALGKKMSAIEEAEDPDTMLDKSLVLLDIKIAKGKIGNKNKELAILCLQSAKKKFSEVYKWVKSKDVLDINYGVTGMCISDCAAHLKVGYLISIGETDKKINNAIWNMDTAARECLPSKVLKQYYED